MIGLETQRTKRYEFKYQYNTKLKRIKESLLKYENDDIKRYIDDIIDLPFIENDDDFINIEWYIPLIRLDSLRCFFWRQSAILDIDVASKYGDELRRDVVSLIDEIRYFEHFIH